MLTAVLPSAPLNLSHNTALRYRTALIYQWTPPLTNGGSELKFYTLGLNDIALNTETEFVVTMQATSYKFVGLKSAYNYEVRIKVTNLIGDSVWSDYVPAITGIEPTRPGLLTFVSTTRTTIDLTWNALQGADTGAQDDSPLTILSYHLYKDDGHAGEFKLIASISGTSYKVQYLRPGLEYRFKYQAENNINLLSAFSTEQMMIAGTIPSAPGSPKLIS